jgi:hypothetical protein
MRTIWGVCLSTALLAACGPAKVGEGGPDAGGCGAGCAAGSVCLAGSCYASTCAVQACGPLQVCVAGQCVDAACVGTVCPSGAVCAAGECLPTSCGSLICGTGNVCVQGQCLNATCVDVSCPAGSLCAAGSCLPSSCGATACPAGAVCVDGGCAAAICVGVACPQGTVCQAGSCAAHVGSPDGGDAGPGDAGPRDAGTEDGGRNGGGDAGPPDSGPPACPGGCATPPGPCYGAGSCVAGACSYPVLTGQSCSGSNPCESYACVATGACAAVGTVGNGTPAGPGALCCGGVATPDDTTSNCGGCGIACSASQPNQTAVCSGGCGTACAGAFAAYAQYACVNWAGHFQVNDSSCPCCAACENGNPFASGAGCGCPAGFGQSAGYRVIDDCNGNHGSLVYFCETGATSSESPWAGAYELDDPVSGGAGCRAANPYTGGCSCPAGSGGTSYRVIADTAGGLIGSTLVMCTTGYAPQTFGGAYEEDDPVAGGVGCRAANPYTGGCSCPAGLGAQEQIRTLVDVPGGFIGSRLYLCSQ